MVATPAAPISPPPRTRGVTDVAFHKKCGIAVADMVKSPWVYRRLRNFRAGIEAGISCFKRAYGAARCTWRGLQHFKAYIWSAVVAHNLVLFARSNRLNARPLCPSWPTARSRWPWLPATQFLFRLATTDKRAAAPPPRAPSASSFYFI